MYRRHYIEQDGNIILYLPNSLRFFYINEQTKAIIEDVCEKDREYVLAKWPINELEYASLIENLEQKREVSFVPDNKLTKLTILLSGICNLRCKYCFANSGSYKDTSGNMSIDTLKQTIDIFFSRYDEIETIMFFGGEPLMNLEAITFACEYINSKYENQEIKTLPKMGMVTNGTMISDEVIEIVKKYNLGVTVSLDGPPIVNDRMRVYANGRGSSEVVEANILKLKKETKQPETIEATYTDVHEKLGISVLDVVKYIKDKFGVSKVHIAPISSMGNSEMPDTSMLPFIKSIPEVHKYNKAGCDYRYLSYESTIEGLKHKQISQYYCEAGISKFAVSTDGDVYACHLFTDEDELKMGNVSDPNLFSGEKMLKLQKRLTEFNKYQHEECSSCYSNTLCKQCIAENYYANGDFFKVHKRNCDFTKSKTEMIISNIADEQSANAAQ